MRKTSRPRRRFSRAARARVGYFLGLVLLAVGVGWQLGYGWGLVGAGVGLAVWSVLLYDVDEPVTPDEQREVFR